MQVKCCRWATEQETMQENVWKLFVRKMLKCINLKIIASKFPRNRMQFCLKSNKRKKERTLFHTQDNGKRSVRKILRASKSQLLLKIDTNIPQILKGSRSNSCFIQLTFILAHHQNMYKLALLQQQAFNYTLIYFFYFQWSENSSHALKFEIRIKRVLFHWKDNIH